MAYVINSLPSLNFTTPAQPRQVTAVVLHATAGTKEGDLYTLSGRDPRRKVSTHYWLGKDGEIVQLVEDDKIAWHAGTSSLDGVPDANRYSLGVELENLNDGRDPYPQAQLDALIWLLREKTTRYGIARSRIVTHEQIALPAGRKSDPRGLDVAAVLDAVYAPKVDPNWRRFTVGPNGAIVRQAKTPNSHEVARLAPGTPVWIQAAVFGQDVDGSDVWLHLSDARGFIHSKAAGR